MNTELNIVTVIQARMGSSRLPGKVMMRLAGKELLVRIMERVNYSMAPGLGTVVVATTTNPEDDAIETLCHRERFPCYRGHETDLLDRHYRAALKYGEMKDGGCKANAVVKIPSDCPLIDPAVIDAVLKCYINAQESSAPYDYVGNLHPATWPDGNDVEIMSMAAMKLAWKEAKEGYEREHTTPFFWEQPERFNVGNVEWETGRDYSMSHRWTIDYREDYTFIHSVYDRLYDVNPRFGVEEILKLLESEPGLGQINDGYAGVNWYRHHLDKLQTVGADDTRLAPGEVNYGKLYQPLIKGTK